eukprot:SAG22_NODE_11926_length_463_cov_0.906593_1_plen_40_part_10
MVAKRRPVLPVRVLVPVLYCAIGTQQQPVAGKGEISLAIG